MCQAELCLASRTEALSQVVEVALPVRHHHGIVANGMVRLSVFGDKCTLPETNSEFTPENGWLEYDRFLLGPGLFSGAMLVSGRVNQVGKKHVFFLTK